MIPGTPQLTANDIKYRINHSQTKCVIADNTAAEKVDHVSILVFQILWILPNYCIHFTLAFPLVSKNNDIMSSLNMFHS